MSHESSVQESNCPDSRFISSVLFQKYGLSQRILGRGSSQIGAALSLVQEPEEITCTS